jgi:hypothetical protein
MAEEPRPLEGQDTDSIRSDIDRTRARIAVTLDAIEARLRPGRLASDARQSITGAAARRVETMRAHPLHTLLVALGALVVVGEILRRRRTRRAAIGT